MQNFSLTLVGISPLLMHSSRLSNPMDEITKAIKKVSGKRLKTDDDHAEIARLEHQGSMYHDTTLGPVIPGDNVFRSLWDAAKKTKAGMKVKEGVIITSGDSPLIYAGPRDVASLWEDKNYVHQASVKVMTNRVIRTRPIFNNWEIEVEGMVDPNILDIEDLRAIASVAGNQIGLGDWRPKFGRFTSTLQRLN